MKLEINIIPADNKFILSNIRKNNIEKINPYKIYSFSCNNLFKQFLILCNMEIANGFGKDKYLKEEFQKLIKKFKVKNIVETGTFKGYTTEEFSKMVDNVYTIESKKEFYLEAKSKLSKLKNVKGFLGSSPEVIEKILPSIEGKTLFFLDAHWGYPWPILDELKQISKLPQFKESIIIIHDFYVPCKDFGFDSYYHNNSFLTLFLKRVFGLLGKIIGKEIVKKQKLDYPFIEKAIKRINPNYKYYYNSKVEGAKRGVIFIHP